MTLQPYDGANRVLLPDGRECWEKETENFFGSETTLSYQYSVDIKDLSTDYWGRVVNLKLQAPDGTWNESVSFMPATPALQKRLREVMEKGWGIFSEDTATAYAGTYHVLDSDSYLKIMTDVLAIVGACAP